MRAGSANVCSNVKGAGAFFFLFFFFFFLITFLPGIASECQYYICFLSQNSITHYSFVSVFGGLSDKLFRLEHLDEKLYI